MQWIMSFPGATAVGETSATASCCSSSEGHGPLFWAGIILSTVLVLYLLIGSKKDEKKHLKKAHKLPNGMFIYAWSGFETNVLYEEIFDKASYRDGGIKLGRGSTVIDAGANIGMFSMWVYRECEGEADVYAFEPIPSTFEVLEKNAQAYGNGRIRPFPFGLNDKETDVVFEHHPNASIWSTSSHELADARVERVTQDMATVLTGSQAALRFIPRFIYVCLLKLVMRWATRKEKVPCHLRRLGDVIKEEKIETIDLLKVDVEGAEFSVLEGINDDQWPIVQQVALEVESFERVYQIRDFLRKKGFHVYWRATEREDGKDKTGSEISSEVCMLYALREPSDSLTADDSGYILREGHTAPKEVASSDKASPARKRSFRR
eukprot:gb/GECG01003223.1/.p1 GENE.gb/GECG01003223.1/~~gb/GECG01003223.1/.p1  ORF type:complete len:377 (+),score=49.39 gb/GECG01003223.1/:1-1131(+)